MTRLEGYARYAVIEDPQGAQLLLLSPERALGGSEGPGSFVWTELWTDDSESATDF
ncbi:MAG: VOC family protein, partial [Gammaproteobacteria bacterium]|nr:VOC family protein [Gammaproteobacteria bacterium]